MKKIKVIFENKYQVIINKPVGIMSHTDNRQETETIADWLKEYCSNLNPDSKLNQIVGIGEKDREGIVHRLDTGTTGVMILALQPESFLFLKKQFHNHTAKKVYQTIVLGHIKNDTGLIQESLSRSRSDFRKKSVKDLFQNDGRGDVGGQEREAVTRYKVLQRLKSKTGQAYSLVECYPETGRTHQIRAHLRSIRHPIVGDFLYGVNTESQEKLQSDFSVKISRPLLHALSLTIKILDGDKNVIKQTFQAPLPLDMKKVLGELK